MDVKTRNDFLSTNYYAKISDRIDNNTFLTSYLLKELRNNNNQQNNILPNKLGNQGIWRKLVAEKNRLNIT